MEPILVGWVMTVSAGISHVQGPKTRKKCYKLAPPGYQRMRISGHRRLISLIVLMSSSGCHLLDDGLIEKSCDEMPGCLEQNPGGSDDSGDNPPPDDTGVSGDGDGDGFTTEQGDCDDEDSSVYPGAEDTWYDGIDSDCGGDSDYDSDGDGFDALVGDGDDCDDEDSSVHPGAEDTWYDGIDSDCGGDSDYDADGDLFDAEVGDGRDCDDTDPDIHPDGIEVNWDGIDQDCSGADLELPRVSAGYQHTCAVEVDGSLSCWGLAGAIGTVPNGTDYVDVITGISHTCALDSSGNLSCFGNNDAEQTDLPHPGGWSQVAAGYYSTCGLDIDGQPECWGYMGDWIAFEPSGTYEQITGGLESYCARKDSGPVSCWGSDDYQQVSEMPPMDFLEVSLSYYAACGLMTDGTPTCWGYPVYDETEPPDMPMVGLDGGYYHFCALGLEGSLACWGISDGVSSLDAGQVDDAPTGTPFYQVSAGGLHTCGVSQDLQILCWGSDSYGQSSVP